MFFALGFGFRSFSFFGLGVFLTVFLAFGFGFGGFSGGGGGGGGPNIYYATQSQVEAGYTKDLATGEKVNFEIGSIKTKHILTVKSVKDNYANVTVESNPINLVLFVGQEAKLNLSSNAFYDIYLKLENISKGRANITMREINERIIFEEEKPRITGNDVASGENVSLSPEKKEKSNLAIWIILVGLFLLFVGIFIGIIISQGKSKIYNQKKSS